MGERFKQAAGRAEDRPAQGREPGSAWAAAARRGTDADPRAARARDQPLDPELPEARQPRQHRRADRRHRHRRDGPAAGDPDPRHRPVGRLQPRARHGDRRAGLPGGRLRRRWSSSRCSRPGRSSASSTASSTSMAACRIRSSSRWPRSASAAASRSRSRSTTRPCAGCPTRSTWLGGLAGVRPAQLALRRRRRGARSVLLMTQGDGLGALDLRGRRRSRGGGRDGHPRQGRAGLDVRDLRPLRRDRRGGAGRPHRRGLAALRQSARARHASPR